MVFERKNLASEAQSRGTTALGLGRREIACRACYPVPRRGQRLGGVGRESWVRRVRSNAYPFKYLVLVS